jgi:transposase
MAYLNIGIDLGIKAHSVAQIRNERGEKLGPTYTFPISKEALDTLLARAREHLSNGDKIRLIIEATGMSWLPVAIYGKMHHCDVVRVKAHKVHDLRKFFSRNRKNDGLDAQTLATVPVVDRDGLEEVYLRPAGKYALSRRCRQRERIVETLTAQKNRIQSFLDWSFPGLTGCFPDPFGAVARTFYRFYANPFKVIDRTPEELIEHLSSASGEKVALETGQALCACAAKACALYEGGEEYLDLEELGREMLPEIALLEALQEQLRAVDEEVARLYAEIHPEKYIESLPGIGKALGPALYGVISDPNRFNREKRCRAFMGYVPRQDDSALTEKKGLPMSQAGPSSARRDLYIAAEIGRQWDPQLAKVYHDEMVYKGHCHTQAVCAVAVRVIGRTLRILKDGRRYQLRDVDGRPVTKQEARQIVEERYMVPEEVRQRMRNRKQRERASNLVRGCSVKNTPDLSRSPLDATRREK